MHIPETLIGVKQTGVDFVVIRAVVMQLAVFINLMQSTREKQTTVQCGVKRLANSLVTRLDLNVIKILI